MEQLQMVANSIAMTMGVAWASGINLYAAILVLGIMGTTGGMVLPPNLEILTHPMVLYAAGAMYLIEFVTDKMPGIDSGWDGLHTFIRIPAGALLAAGAVGDVDPALALSAGILGGGVTAGTHATKSGARILINASPEPFSNIVTSVAEDLLVIGGLWTALQYPWAFLCFLLLFVLFVIWIMPKIWRGIKKIFGFLSRLFEPEEGEKKPPRQLPLLPPGASRG
jgi:hypothetical protein